MSSQRNFNKTSVALAFTLTLGLTACWTGSASADALQAYENGGERIYGFAYAPDRRGTGACEGRQGAANAGALSQGDALNQNPPCRY